MKCSACHAEIENPKARFCNKCGQPIPQSKSCSACGKQLNPNAKFCDECGTPVVAIVPKKVEPELLGYCAGTGKAIKPDDPHFKCLECGELYLEAQQFEDKAICQGCAYDSGLAQTLEKNRLERERITAEKKAAEVKARSERQAAERAKHEKEVAEALAKAEEKRKSREKAEEEARAKAEEKRKAREKAETEARAKAEEQRKAKEEQKRMELAEFIDQVVAAINNGDEEAVSQMLADKIYVKKSYTLIQSLLDRRIQNGFNLSSYEKLFKAIAKLAGNKVERNNFFQFLRSSFEIDEVRNRIEGEFEIDDSPSKATALRLSKYYESIGEEEKYRKALKCFVMAFDDMDDWFDEGWELIRELSGKSRAYLWSFAVARFGGSDFKLDAYISRRTASPDDSITNIIKFTSWEWEIIKTIYDVRGSYSDICNDEFNHLLSHVDLSNDQFMLNGILSDCYRDSIVKDRIYNRPRGLKKVGALLNIINQQGISTERFAEEFNLNPLMLSVIDGDIKAVKLAIDNFPDDINQQNSDGLTSLMIAAANKRCDLSVIKALIDVGSDINAKCNAGFSILAHAVSRDEMPVIVLLIKRGADLLDESIYPATSPYGGFIVTNNAHFVRDRIEEAKARKTKRGSFFGGLFK